MTTINLAEAKAKLSFLLDKVQAGEEITITRHGRAIARITAVRPVRRPVASLAEFRAGMPRWRESSAQLLREMRDEEGR